MKAAIIIIYCLFQLRGCNLLLEQGFKGNIVNALIGKSFLQKYEIYDHQCTIQTVYDCLVKCDCSKNPSKCTMDTCVYMCYLFSKPKLDCPPDLHKQSMVISVFASNKTSSRNPESDCLKRCPWSTHCDQCHNCKWCWLCSSCSIPSTNCQYCKVCKGAESSCAKCCGY